MADKFEIDVKAFAKALQSGQDLNGKNGLLAPLIKQVTEAALEAEVDEHLTQKEAANRKHGSSRKTVKTSSGPFQLDTPRDRNGSFEPQTVKKYQTRLTDEMERKIISLFALGNSYQNISEHLINLYDLEVSNGTINAITDRLVPELRA
ncbi:hypothetical protein EN01_019105 [Vibrio parahaemolyticus]|nr:hypothetical protein BBM91_16760 [Vibrio parahaemolyticus]OQU14696.1 hypothetical protein EN01_019105 [Vibrio parahaemolyticus]PIS71631.1 hypothetical protein H271_03370 [Vibrio parahaemolyticus 1911C]